MFRNSDPISALNDEALKNEINSHIGKYRDLNKKSDLLFPEPHDINHFEKGFPNRAEIEKICRELKSYVELLESFTSLNQVIDAPQHASEQKDQLFQADAAYSQTSEFIQMLLKDHSGKPNIQDIRIITQLNQDLLKLLKSPQDQSNQELLKKHINDFRYRLETNPYAHAAWTVGRALVATLECFLGATLVFASIFTGFGLVVTALSGLATWGNSWGPLTWGTGLFKDGVKRYDSGPTEAQIIRAKNLASQLEVIIPAPAPKT